MNDNVKKLETGYAPKTEPIEGLKLPIELKNREGKVLAYIDYWKHDNKYHWRVEGIDNYYRDRGHSTFMECFEECFGEIYQKMQDLRKENEKHNRLISALKESLSTPFNKL